MIDLTRYVCNMTMEVKHGVEDLYVHTSEEFSQRGTGGQVISTNWLGIRTIFRRSSRLYQQLLLQWYS